MSCAPQQLNMVQKKQEEEKRPFEALEMVLKCGRRSGKSAAVSAEEKGGDSSTCTTLDGSVDFKGRPAIKSRTGRWSAGFLLLVNQGLATLAFFGVGVNMVLFLTRVMKQNNADAANSVSKWTGTVYLFSLLGAFLSDSYWGRYKTCAIFQAIFVLGLVMLSFSSYLFLLRPIGCGDPHTKCSSHSTMEIVVFNIATYLVALGNGGYQPNIATFGADQFDEEDPKESLSKIAFFSYFYLSLNLGSLFSNTILSYLEDKGLWTLAFWLSAGSAFLALLLFLAGTPWYRHFPPAGNPLSRVGKVIVSASRKSMLTIPSNESELFEVNSSKLVELNKGGTRKLLHTKGLTFLDRAAILHDSRDFNTQDQTPDPWRLCTVTQIEEVKSVLRLLPIWLCTILYSVVFTQMASLFVVQGAAMDLNIAGFRIPASSMSAFDILSVAAFIYINKHVINPLVSRLNKDCRTLTELQRMGIGLILAVATMVASGIVEHYRLKHVTVDINGTPTSTLSVFWQTPQYALLGASEVYMYVGQLEFFNGQTPDGLKTFGSALCMTSISFGNYVSTLIVTVVMAFTKKGGKQGWIPGNLNEGRLDNFYFLLAILTSVDFFVYLLCAKWYKYVKMEGRCGSEDEEEEEESNTSI